MNTIYTPLSDTWYPLISVFNTNVINHTNTNFGSFEQQMGKIYYYTTLIYNLFRIRME